MSRAIEIYPIEKDIQKYLDKIRNDPYNSKTLQKYYEARISERLSPARIRKCIMHMMIISEILSKPFDVTTENDLRRVFAKLVERKYADSTFDDFQAITKHFFKWFRECTNGYPSEVRWIIRKKKRKIEYRRNIRVTDLLTPEEKIAMANAADNPRDRALVQVTNECGKRPGNVLTAHVGDVEFDELGAVVQTVGKTGPSTMRLISSAPDLAVWLNCHPLRNDPNAPLWIVLQGKNKRKQLSYGSANQRLKRIAKNAGIKKKVFFYIQRYTRIYESMPVLTEDLQCQQFDWAFGSSQPSRYKAMFRVHEDDAQCLMNGIKLGKADINSKPELMKPKQCIKCGLSNSFVSKFCNRCAYPLDDEKINELANKKPTKESDDLLIKLNEIMKDPKRLEALSLILNKI